MIESISFFPFRIMPAGRQSKKRTGGSAFCRGTSHQFASVSRSARGWSVEFRSVGHDVPAPTSVSPFQDARVDYRRVSRAPPVAVCDDVALQEFCYLLFNLTEHSIEVGKRLELVSKRVCPCVCKVPSSAFENQDHRKTCNF